jgi:hypothetical protein
MSELPQILSEHTVCYEELLRLFEAHNRLISVLKRYVTMQGGQVIVQEAMARCELDTTNLRELIRYRRMLDDHPTEEPP